MELHNDMILLWGLSTDAWITIATVITIIAVMGHYPSSVHTLNIHRVSYLPS